MTAALRLILAALVWAVVSSAAWSQVACTAASVPVTFASVYSGGTLTESGSGALDVSCTGGTASETVYLCATLGAGSGLGDGTTNTRYLTGSTPPVYSLLANGATALAIDQPVALGSITLGGGAGSASFILSGTIDWTGYVGGYADLQSTFADQFLLTYGSQPDCTGTGGSSQIAGFSVSGSIFPSCTVDASPMAFGSVAATNSPDIDQTATITVNCPTDVSYTVSLGDGLWYANGSAGSRAMKAAGNDFLSYALFEDALRQQPWNGVPGTGASQNQSITVYGRIPSGQNNLAAGTYSDIVVVTVEYTLPD